MGRAASEQLQLARARRPPAPTRAPHAPRCRLAAHRTLGQFETDGVTPVHAPGVFAAPRVTVQLRLVPEKGKVIVSVMGGENSKPATVTKVGDSHEPFLPSELKTALAARRAAAAAAAAAGYASS